MLKRQFAYTAQKRRFFVGPCRIFCSFVKSVADFLRVFPLLQRACDGNALERFATSGFLAMLTAFCIGSRIECMQFVQVMPPNNYHLECIPNLPHLRRLVAATGAKVVITSPTHKNVVSKCRLKKQHPYASTLMLTPGRFPSLPTSQCTSGLTSAM